MRNRGIFAPMALAAWAAGIGAAGAANYYVSNAGDDGAGGASAGAAFKTIQKAASRAVAGDTVFILAGVYRETVTPANSGADGKPIVFTRYHNDSVVVSANDLVTGWQAHQGNIYKAPLAWNLGLGQNFVLVGSEPMPEARFPNMDFRKEGGLWNRTFFNQSLPLINACCTEADGFGSPAKGFKIRDSRWNKPADFWKGGYFVCYRPGDSWTAITGAISASNGDTLSITPSYPWFKFGAGPGWIGGALNALDAEREWAVQDGFLYLWAPGGANPSGLKVEAKRRRLAFDLRGRSRMVLDGLNLEGGIVEIKNGSDHIVQNCRFTYGAHSTLVDFNFRQQLDTGNSAMLYMYNSSRNLIRNCEFEHSMNSAIWEDSASTDNHVTDCMIRDIGASGGQKVAVQAWLGPKKTFLFDHNTVSELGNHAITSVGTFEYNIIHDYCILGDDCGGFYTWGNDGYNTEIRFNWFYSNYTTYLGGDLYFDDGASNYRPHHNVLWAGTGTQGRPYVLRGNYDLPDYNTIYTPSRDVTLPGVGANDIIQSDSQRVANYWKFNDPDHFDFTLAPGSPAIDKGKVVTGIAEKFNGAAPDLGAYESGAPPWIPGRHTGPEYAVQPTITPTGGFASGAQGGITLASVTAGADIRYTLDGSEPTEQSPKYAAPLSVNATYGTPVNLKARAFKAGLSPSNSAVAVFEGLKAPDTVSGDKPGLEALKYTVAPPHWNSLPDFASLTAKATCPIPNFYGRDDAVPATACLTVNEQAKEFLGVWYKGYIEVKTPGVYTFYVRSLYTTMDRGYQLLIGNRPLVTNDPNTGIGEAHARIGLQAGKHIIQLKLRSDWGDERSGLVSWEGPGISKALVPDAVLTSGGTVKPATGLAPAAKAALPWYRLRDGALTAGFDGPGRHELLLADMSGRRVLARAGEGPARYTLASASRPLRPGMYFLRLRSSAGEKAAKIPWCGP